MVGQCKKERKVLPATEIFGNGDGDEAMKI